MKLILGQDLEALSGDQLFEQAPIGMAVVSDKNSFLRVNSAFCRFLGYSKQELLGKTVRDVTYPDDWANSLEVIRRYRSARKSTKPFEKRYRHKNGKAVWGEVSPFLMGKGRRKAQYIVAQVMDITARKQAEDALRLSNERFRTALAGSPTVVFSQDRELRYTWAYNPSPCFRTEDFLGKRDSDFMNAHDAKRLMRLKKAVMQTGRRHREEVTVHLPIGETVFDVTTDPLRDERGKITGIICAATDITKHKQTEQALREGRDRLEAVFKASPVGIFTSRQADGTIIEANDAFLKIIGYSAKETIGRSALSMGLWADPKDRRREIVRLRKQGRLDGIEVRFRRKSGEVVDLIASVRPLKLGNEACVLGTLVDMSQRKRLEEALRQANEGLDQKVKERTARLRQLTEELTRAEHAERRRIADILHEQLQQHLCGIKFRASHLKEGSPTPAMIDSADRLINDLDDAINLTRTLTTELHPPVLSHLGVRESIEWLASDLQEKMGLSVTVRIDKRVPMISEESKIFTFEAVRELLLNVAKHAKVKTAEVRLGSERNGQFRMQVKDLGVGFDTKKDKLTANRFGLFRIQERTETFGGRFEVISHSSKGTTVWIVLPSSATSP